MALTRHGGPEISGVSSSRARAMAVLRATGLIVEKKWCFEISEVIHADA